MRKVFQQEDVKVNKPLSITDLVIDIRSSSEKEIVYKAQELIRGEDPEGSMNQYHEIYVTFKSQIIPYNNQNSILLVMKDVTTHHKLREAQ